MLNTIKDRMLATDMGVQSRGRRQLLHFEAALDPDRQYRKKLH